MESDQFLKIGKVSSVDEGRATARVYYEDRGKMVSYDYPIVFPFTLNDKAYYIPSIDERVLCLIQPNAPSVGFIIGSYYADTRAPEKKDRNKFYTKYEDGTLVEYDKKEHLMTVEIPAESVISLSVKTAGDIKLDCSGNIYIKSEKEFFCMSVKDMTLSTNAKFYIQTSEDANISAAGDINITTASSANISVTENAEITVKGDSTIMTEGDSEIKTKGKATIYSEDDMTVQSLKDLTLTGSTSSMTL